MGRTPVYLANNIFRLDPGSKLTEDKEFGINGFMNKITLIKSRSARAGQEVEFVFNPEIGYDNVLTNYYYMKKEGLVSGAGRSFYFNFEPNVKFSQKEFKNKYLSNDEFRKSVIKETRMSMRKFINTTGITTDKSEDPENDGEDVVITESAEAKAEAKKMIAKGTKTSK